MSFGQESTMKVIISILSIAASLTIIGAEERICAVRKREIETTSDGQNSADGVGESFSISNQTESEIRYEKCNRYCYAFLQEENTPNGTRINIFHQGCWDQKSHECENTECIANRWTKALSNAKFCCCKEDYCNVNVTDPVENKLLLTSPASKSNLSVIVTATEYLEQADSEHLMLVTVITLASVLLVTLTVIVLIYQVYKNNLLMRLGKPLSYDDNDVEGNGLRTGTYTFDHLKLSTIVGEGRYGSVWQGSMGDQEVAVKIFPGQYQSHFLNELEIYRLPFMEHPSLLHYYGSDERVSMDSSTEYLLVFSYAPGGTLTDFLRYHTYDWATFCKMGSSIVKGLAYLHTDIRRGDKFKPCIAHRDMNSRNILMKADGTCCICDLGLAVQISGSKYFTNGEEQHAETKSINEVGTLQYIAPEVLEGAVNLRDCESSLKQIDVYAMGLILWELVSRCNDIYAPGNEVPPYRMPFEKEIGLHPTFEQMQVLVSRNKARPLLEGTLVDKPGVRLIKETMEDCWDSDAEARLTALCIEERLMELQSQRIKMYFTDGSPLMNSHCGLVPSTTNSLYGDAPHHDGTRVTHDGNDVAVDNLVTLAPNESSTHEHSSKNSNETAAICNSTSSSSSSQPPQQPLQPYQGRNPCLERNLMTQSESCEELGCQGNILVNRSSKHQHPGVQTKTSSETQSLVPHDYLGHHHHGAQQISLRPVTPIPYVQNVISECSGGSTTTYNKLKQTNVQESCYTALPTNLQEASPRRHRFSGWTSLKKMLANKKMMYQQHQPAYTKCQVDREDSKSNLLASKNANQAQNRALIENKYVNRDEDSNASSHSPSNLPLVELGKRNEGDLSRRESLDRFNEASGSRDRRIPGDTSSMRAKGRGKPTTARFSLYDDRMMCNILTRDGDDSARRQDGNVSSSSVPFGMDFADDEQHARQAQSDAKDMTCL